MTDVAILYGTCTGTTKRIAERLQLAFGDPIPSLLDVGEARAKDIHGSKLVVLVLPTWGIGDLADDWEEFLLEIEAESLEGFKLAILGLGDQVGHPDSFVDAMGLVYDKVVALGANVIGAWPTDGYRFLSSRAVRNDTFVGLAIDENSQSQQTGARIDAWVRALLVQL